MKISVVILNYRTPALTVKALGSLAQAVSGFEIERIVVDNASGDGSVEFIRDRSPLARVIELPENLGFASGMNMGAKAASGDYLLLMNSDVEALPGSINILTDYMQANPDAGLVAPLLVDKDGNPARTLLVQPTLLRLLVPAISKMHYWKWQRRIGTEPLEVEATEGAAILVSRTAIQKAGLLDEDFFFYGEILEFCKRMRDNGFKVTIVPKARMIHARGSSTAEIGRASRIEFKRSEYLLIKKSMGDLVRNLVIATDFLFGLFRVIFYALGCLLSLGIWKRGREKLAVYSGLLFWIAAGMPGRSTSIYEKLFGKWD